jgi:sugar/nucleoside kinase (ribokinase family)
LWNDARQAVVVTCGAAGCWYRDPSLPSWATHHFPAPDVDAVDTTGCGDVFHGIYAAALTAGLTMEERLQRATIAAAIKATRYAGLDSLPSRVEVDEFAQRWPG